MISKVLEKIPKQNFLVIEYLVRFLRDLLFAQNLSLSRQAVSRVFGSVLLRPPSDLKKKSTNEEAIFIHILLNKKPW